MAAVAARTRRPVPLPLLWLFLAHVVATFPDFLFAGGVAHERWMDVFLGHITTHLVTGRNFTWFVVFLLALGTHLGVLARLPPAEADERTDAVRLQRLASSPSSPYDGRS
jgi:hypothetical protein